jgi:uncharacterized protein (TIGR02271 family)
MDSNLSTSSPDTPGRVAAASQAPVVIPIIEERAIISREVVESGRVRLAKTVHEREEVLEVPLQHEEVLVERVAINQLVPDGAPVPGLRYDGDMTIIPVLKEVVVTRLLIVEEIRVLKRTVSTTHTETLPLRHEEMTIERQSTAPADPAAAPPQTAT